MNRGKWIAVCAALLAGSGAIAASPDTGRPLQMMPGGPPPLPSERVEAELAYLKTALKITPEQMGEWNSVADVLRQMARHRDARVLTMRAALDNGAAPSDPITVLERRQAELAEESHDLAELIAAAKPLYARLRADQKKAAEWSLVPPHDAIFLERRPLPDLGRLPPVGPPLPE